MGLVVIKKKSAHLHVWVLFKELRTGCYTIITSKMLNFTGMVILIHLFFPNNEIIIVIILPQVLTQYQATITNLKQSG